MFKPTRSIDARQLAVLVAAALLLGAVAAPAQTYLDLEGQVHEDGALARGQTAPRSASRRTLSICIAASARNVSTVMITIPEISRGEPPRS